MVVLAGDRDALGVERKSVQRRRTEPSIEFSKGTSARSASPSATAITASWIVGTGRGSTPAAARALAARSASSEKVPAGPRKATESGGMASR